MPARSSRATPASSARRGQTSTTTANGRGSSNSSNSAALPPYEEPLDALDPQSKHELSTLPIRHDLSGLHARLKNAHERLASAAADLNELATQRRVTAAKLAAKGTTPDAEVETYRQELEQQVVDLTGAIEGGVRSVVDRQARLEMQEEVLRELSANVPGRGSRTGPAPTQTTMDMTPTQGTGVVDGEEQAGDGADAEDTPPPSALNTMRAKLADAETNYNSLSMRERYSAHNSYVSFRRLLHSAQYPDDEAAPPVPHASTWFDEVSSQPQHLGIVVAGDGPATAGTAVSGEQLPPPATQPDEDSDIEAVAERTSIRCPLTLQPMVNPVTSTKCPHSFERDAIAEIIGQVRRRGQLPAAKCPVCEVMLTHADLQPDLILKRKIARIQAAEAQRAAADADDDDDDDNPNAAKSGHRPEHITSSSPVHTPRSARVVRLKKERVSGVQQRR